MSVRITKQIVENKTDRIGDVGVVWICVCFGDIVKTVVGSVSTWWSYSCTLEYK